MNDDVVLSWLEPSDTNLVGRLSKLIDPPQLGDELYLSVLTRQPSEEELVELMTYLAAHEADRPAAIGRLAWALLASTEFAVNH